MPHSVGRRLRLAFCGRRMLFLDAVAQLLARRGHLVIATAATVAELAPQLEQQAAHVVVVDGIGDRADLAHVRDVVPHASVLVIGSLASSANGAADPGGVHFVSRDPDVDQLVKLVEQLGGVELVASASGEADTDSRRPLTRREREVLLRLCNGETTAELARGLGIAESTAREHVQNLFRKLGVHTRAQAVSLALGEGLL